MKCGLILDKSYPNNKCDPVERLEDAYRLLYSGYLAMNLFIQSNFRCTMRSGCVLLTKGVLMHDHEVCWRLDCKGPAR